ncbi:DMT family transporter [Lysinibacillus sp. SGAir0095]|uniref:DMT family transporter n=1 Tax=Lysinibacillus sp. SGAir0095 TaxID=2070463 RepID=UPI0010CD5DD1|nr:EamA family transporter [Lysinibacillus sp. SGAir0095]QCR32551.1 EamA family transporter [Lysinibacillus sp. SGAir0095]
MILQGRKKGIILVLTAAFFWGISGTVSQYLFQVLHIRAEWLTTVRLLSAGLLLTLIAYKQQGNRIFDIWRHKADILGIIIFGIIGMIGVQYTYLAAIQHGNAATATILQYLGPAIVTSYFILKAKRRPTTKEIIAVFLALLGTFLLVTHGNIQSLSISKLGFFWGILSAFGLAFYTIHPIELLKRWGSTIVVGWGMIIGGVVFSFVAPPWKFEGEWTFTTNFAFLFVVLCGTVLSFYSYLESIKYLSASETSLFACAEPLSAAITSVLFLGVSFGWIDWIGSVFILLTIVVLAKKQKASPG